MTRAATWAPPTGLALYVRAISTTRHGSPAQLAKKLRDGGLSWVALAGPWHDAEGTRSINRPSMVRRYADACATAGVVPYVWGYPWAGSEAAFIDELVEGAGDHARVLLDPELGISPTRASTGRGKAAANARAELLVELLAERLGERGVVGVSTYGSGVALRWFPALAFTGALERLFPSRSFIGGQTYTDDARVDPSIDGFRRAIAKAGPTVALVPNFGLYSRGGTVRAKTPRELERHLATFLDEPDVAGLIGWAENFAGPTLWPVLARSAAALEARACLP